MVSISWFRRVNIKFMMPVMPVGMTFASICSTIRIFTRTISMNLVVILRRKIGIVWYQIG